MNTQDFSLRHIGINATDAQKMLQTIGESSIDTLINKTIPADIRLQKEMNLPVSLSEFDVLQHLKTLANLNQQYKTYIGFGYNGTILPSPIQRNILENPGWYTAYTPYQAEIAQGRLEALLNFQTLVTDLTGLPMANASLLDEATAAAEAMHLLFEARNKDQKKNESNHFFVSKEVFPQTIAVLTTKAVALGIEIVVGNHLTIDLTAKFYGALLQYPAKHGEVYDYTDFVQKAKQLEIKTAVAADILALTLLVPPAEWGADIAVGTTQRLGIPMGYGGPHAAYFACKEEYKRMMPGRIIGVSQDTYGNRALRMALQTREQHIKRERATSNICTAQVLLAVMASMYAVYHGPKGLKFIANQIHKKAQKVEIALDFLGYEICNQYFFDTISFNTKDIDVKALQALALEREINLNYFSQGNISLSINETISDQDIENLILLFADFKGRKSVEIKSTKGNHFPENLQRKTAFLTHDVFNQYHSETELMRYIKKLERKDLALNHSMIALGSCTMKLNAATQLMPLSWAEFANIHPFVPKNQAEGYQTLIKNLENYLSEITGFHATSLQPNSGAQGEYAGLMVIRAYHIANGDSHRNVVLIPESAHGTNPASAVLAGMKVVVVKNTEKGEINWEDLTEKVEKHSDSLSAFMVTYPSTYGIFDEGIKNVTKFIHQHGGQVYMDGANMNAQVGLTNPGAIGADVCHLNLHKTFAIPHGGGGPGVGPICVAKHLAPFLPSNPNVQAGGENPLDGISAAPYGSAFILTISYSYIRLLGADGLKRSTEAAILSANYMKTLLKPHYNILYANANDCVAHEMIMDCRNFKSLHIEAVDLAKRLIDFGFHAPTVSFPVPGTLMIEPTESESKAELDRFAEALITIKSEIEEIANGTYPQDNNVLSNAPHALKTITADTWDYPYTRAKAAYPLDWIRENKFFASVSRIDDAFGDRNLVCTCEPMDAYM